MLQNTHLNLVCVVFTQKMCLPLVLLWAADSLATVITIATQIQGVTRGQ